MKEPRVIKALDHLDDELISGAIQRGNKMTRTNKIFVRWGALAAAIALLLISSVMLTRFIISGTPSAVIALDVNPSLEIEVNGEEKVISVNPLNQDAVTVVGDMEFKGVGLEMAINALIGSMLRNGFISADQNSILISVDANDANRAAFLRESLTEAVSSLLSGNNIEASVLTQIFDRETEQTEAGASAAVSALADKILAAGLKNAHGVPYTREELVCMKINELKLILDSKDLKVDGLASSGNAGEGKYIGRDAALGIALAKAGFSRSDIRDLGIELDFDSKKKLILYEVEFKSGKTEYEYDINAESGEIINEHRENDNDTIDPPSANISEDEALAIALRDAGLAKADVREIDCELDDGLWKIEFETAQTEYEYEIDPASGAIKNRRTEPQEERPAVTDPPVTQPPATDPPVTDPPVTQPPAPNPITDEEALEIALADSGLKISNIRDIDIELEDGVWSVDFESADTEYEYKIDPATGKILGSKTEPRDDDGEQTVPPSSSVTKESALAAALADAGLTREQVRDIEIELDDGVWNVEFETKTHSYEYEIDPKTNKILHKEIERENR